MKAKVGVLIFLAVWLTATPVAETKGNPPWTSKTVTVKFYGADAWLGIVERAVYDLNATMPARGPQMRLVDMPERTCEEGKNQKPGKPTIAICTRTDRTFHGATNLVRKDKKDTLSRVWLIGTPGADRYTMDFHQNTACHELMHALTNVDDDYRYQQDSCVQGLRPDPGSWDEDRLNQMYGGKKKGRR